MASGQIVSIKIPPYLKEFFIHRHGAEPIKATQATKFFVVLAQYLTNKSKGISLIKSDYDHKIKLAGDNTTEVIRLEEEKEKKIKAIKYKLPITEEDTMLVELPYNKVINVRSMNYIPECSMPEIKKYIYGLFYGSFISYMNNKVLREHWSIKYAIINFIDEHDMNWNKTNYETLKKIFDRYRHPEPKKDEKMLATPDGKKGHFRPSPVPQNYEYF